MQLHDVTNPTPYKHHHRVGRGIAAGQGKTAGRGTKGQNARAGNNLPRRFEGGQTSLTQRLPKLNGFRSLAKPCVTVRYDRLERVFEDGMTITPALLKSHGLMRTVAGRRVKVVASAQMSKKYRFQDVAMTQSVLKHIGEAAA